VSKKIFTTAFIIGIVFLTIIFSTNATEKDGVDLVSKNSYANNLETGEYKIELKIPGQDGEHLHDEIILMIDGSYSLDEEWPKMKEAIVEIAKTVLNGNGNTQLTLMAFGMGDNEVITHVKNVNTLENYLGDLPGTLLYGRSSTNCEAGFTGVMEYINNHDNSLNEAHVIFISDGRINTDETPYNFYNWKNNTWLKYTIDTIVSASFEYECLHIMNGGNKSNAFINVFNKYTSVKDALENATYEEKLAWANQVWEDVYNYSNLDKNTAYPVSDAERAFVKYDKENNTYIQNMFYYALIGRKYPNQAIRTPKAGNELAEHNKVKTLYMVDYDNYTAWMDTGITSSKSTFIKSNGISGLIDALSSVLTNLSTTPYNNIVITDYMSKWVNLDLNSIKIVNDITNETIYTLNDGWLVDEALRPTKKEEPKIIEKISNENYIYGGNNVIGNTNGDIYKITWYVKDGALLRKDSYHLEYIINMDTNEHNFEYEKLYPTNGTTNVTYVDENNNKIIEEIKIPNGKINTPNEGIVNLKKGTASHIAYFYIDKSGNIEYFNKIDFDNNDTHAILPYKEGYTLVTFIKQAQSGMIWSSNKLNDTLINKVIATIKEKDKAYKGHDTIVYGNGNHELTYTNGKKKKNKTVIYSFNNI